MRSKSRRWDSVPDDDPLAGLVNLFDLWMVFSIALLLALVAASRLPELSQSTPQSDAADVPANESSKLDQYRVSNEKLTGEGQRLGTAYRLKNGEVVYVPD
jgi:hypothetical protein